MKNSDPTLAALGLPEKIAGYLAAAGVKTLSAIEAELEATGNLEHLEGIGPAYSEDVLEAIKAWREMAVDAEPVANDEAAAEEAVAEEPIEEAVAEEAIEEPIEEAVAEEPTDEAVAEEPIEEAVAEEPIEEAVAESIEEPVGEEPAEEPVADNSPRIYGNHIHDNAAGDAVVLAEAPIEEAVAEEPAEAPIEEAVAEEPAEAPTDEAVAEEPIEEPVTEEPKPGPLDLIRREAAALSVLESAVKVLMNSLQEALEDFYRDRLAKSPSGRGGLQRIVLRRELIIGGAPQTIGTPLAVVQLEPGVSLNFLVDAVRNGLASAK